MSNVQLPPRYKAVHTAGGALLYAALGAAWALVGALELRPLGITWLNVSLGVMTGLLLIAGFRGLQRASELPEDEDSDEQRQLRAKRTRLSHRVLRAQGFLITGISAALILTGQQVYIAAATSAAVGLHFIALAAIHRTNGEYLIGGLMVALAGSAMYVIPNAPEIPNGAMNAVAGLGTAAILWGSSVLRLVQQERAWAH
jgi:hypothetical protein